MPNDFYNLPDKIAVPKTLALASPELKSRLVGKRPIKQLHATLQDLEGELYDTLLEEINSQLPEEQKQMLKDHEEMEHKGMMMEHMERMASGMEKMCDMMEDREEHIEMMMPEEITVSNLSDIKIPPIPKFPKIEIPKFDDTKIVAGLSEVKKAIGELPAPIAPLETIKVEKPDWYVPTDLDPTNKIIKLTGEGLGGALAELQESLHDPSRPVKVQVLDKKGNVISKFGGDAVAVGGSGGGAYTGIRDGLKFTPDSDYNLPIGGLYQASPTTLADGEQGILGLTANRELKVNISSSAITFTGTEYDDGDARGTATGTLIMGDDGTNIQSVHVDTSGDLQIDVLTMPTVTVQATNLDIRDLTHVSDSVRIGDGTDLATVRDVTGAKSLDVSIVDGSGNQITSFGGGTEYTEGDIDASITGGAMMMEVAADTLQPVQGTVAGGLLVNLGTNNDVTVTGTVDLGATDNAVLDAIAASVAAIDTGTTTIIGHLDGVEGLLTTIDADTGNVVTSVQLIDDTVFTDDTSTHATGTTKVLGIGAVADPTDAAVNANDIGMPAMTTTRFLKVVPQANSGVDIGDVDVTSVVPGTGATNLGKAEDAGHTTGDVGVMALGVANTGDANISGTTLDYTPFATDLTGAVHVMGKVAADAAAPANPLLVGVRARNSVPTAVSAAEDLTNLWALLTGALVVSNPIGTGTTGTLDLTSASTTYRITTSSTIVHNFKIQAPEQNSGVVTWGYSSTFANNYMRVRAGEHESFGTVDISLIYFGSSSAGDDIVYSYTS